MLQHRGLAQHTVPNTLLHLVAHYPQVLHIKASSGIGAGYLTTAAKIPSDADFRLGLSTRLNGRTPSIILPQVPSNCFSKVPKETVLAGERVRAGLHFQKTQKKWPQTILVYGFVLPLTTVDAQHLPYKIDWQ